MDKLIQYRKGEYPLPQNNMLWPLYGAGFENMGQDGKPISVDFPSFGANQLLVRHDACGLCFSDIKVITQGQNHVRVLKDMKTNPVVLGHEVSMTIIGVGENLKNRYKIGDRVIIEADIYIDNQNLAYGYYFQGGLSQFNVIDEGIINSDNGDMLIPIKPEMGYAESALIEPWACVVAAYRLDYRNKIKPNGYAWFIGGKDSIPYTISRGFDSSSHPAKIFITDISSTFKSWLLSQCTHLGIEVIEVSDPASPPVEFFDDIVVLGADPALIEQVSPHLAQFGIMAIIDDKPMRDYPSIDVGRIHYHRWLYVGSESPDIAVAYGEIPLDPNIKSGSMIWFAGAGGPIGRMHVQRAIEFATGPGTILCTDISDLRLEDLCTTYGDEAKNKGINLICLNPTKAEEYHQGISRFSEHGFDYIVVLAPVPAVIEDCYKYLARGGIMNVFAGVVRGTMVKLDLSGVYLKGQRVIGHSGSNMMDMTLTLQNTEQGTLSTNKSVAAIGSLSAARDGLLALKNTVYPGKVVIFPNIKEMPLTALPDLKQTMPSVFKLLKDGREWTNEAEEEFLRLMLP